MKKIFVPIIFVALCGVVKAQQAFTNKGNLKINSGTSMVAFGDFTNSSAASLVNNGSLYIKGSVTNDQSSMTVGSGTLYLNGTSSQTIGGTQVFKTYDLVSNNSAGITLNNDLSVSGSHTFSVGLITTSSTPNYMIYEAGSSYSGDDDTKHVNGWVKKYGNTDFIFPVGDGSYERTAAMINLSLSSEFNCRYNTTTPNINNVSAPVVSVDRYEYWDINQVSGGTAQISLNWDNSKVHFPNWALSDILVSEYTGGFWTDAGGSGTATGNTATTGTLTSATASAFSQFTFASRSYPVPLRLINFNAEKMSGFVLLSWTTQNEVNVNHYEVERSSDATQFTTIGSKNALNLSYTQQYELEDHNPFSGIIYYRLKSIDNDGKFSYSKIVAVANNSILGNKGIVVLNPAHNAITILNRTIQAGDFNYQLSTLSGQVLQKGIINMQANGIAVLPVASTIPVGIYMLELLKDQMLSNTKVLLH